MSVKKLKIIPYPKKVERHGTGSLVCTGISSVGGAYITCFAAFASLMEKIHDVNLAFGGDGIRLHTDNTLKKGAYKIKINKDFADIFASDEEGISYALATVMQIAEPEGYFAIKLPYCEIEDMPDRDYRTLMVDLGRQWHPFESLLCYVDLCYLYKIKYLHLHFIDSVIYTLPSRKFPKMPTEGKHYSFAEIDALNEYAKEKGVEIIPEIEIPGHAKPMVIAYPELFADIPDSYEAQDDYALFFANVKNNLVCAGKPDIMNTVDKLVSEVISMFPYSRYLHIGGDEAAIGEWANCRDCKKYMKENNINGVKGLYSDFIKRATDLVLSKGKTPIVWEGFPKEGAEKISKEVIVTAWESYYHLAPELLEEGFKITNSSWEPLYTIPKNKNKFVPKGRWTTAEVLKWNIFTWKNWNKKTAAYEHPITVEPTENVIGATFCVWENNYNDEIEAVRENLAAMSEKVWNINSEMTPRQLTLNLKAILPIAKKLTEQINE